MKSLITKSIWMLCLMIQGTIMFAQSTSVTGTVIDEYGETLPGVTIFEKGTNRGTVSDLEGFYALDLSSSKAILVFTFTGYKDVELVAGNARTIDIQMAVSVESLEEVVVTGIRRSQLQEVQITRNAATVIEAITPEDVGSFSDVNVTDALQRVAEVQIERNVDGVSGDRASIRGIGPQFVRVTLNGRTPISAGNSGRSDLRKFNLNVIPSEIISGARIKKTGQAKEVSTSIGGTIDFQTLRPLEKKYKKGKNYFASINIRESSNTEFKDIDFNHRISGVFGGKINDKLGAVVSVMYRDEVFLRDEFGLRGYRILDLREDTNNDGQFNVADGDQLYEDILVSATINNQYTKDSRKQLALSTAVQFKPSEKLDFLFDFTTTRLKNDSDRQFFQLSLAQGGRNSLLGQTDNNFFSPGSLVLNGNNLLFVDGAGASTSRVTMQNRNTLFDTHTTNDIGGLRTTYKASDKLTLSLDLSYSYLDFFENIQNVGTARLDGGNYDKNDFSLDLRGERPLYSLPAEMFDPTAFRLLNSTMRHVRTIGENYAGKLDLSYDLTKKTTLSIGTRIATVEFDTREAAANTNAHGGYTEEQKAQYLALRSGENNLTEEGFLNGEIGLSQWLNTPGQAILDLKPAFAALDGGRVFDFDTPLKEVMTEDGNLIMNSGRSYSAKETRFSNYIQFDTKTKLFNVPVNINFGVRALNTVVEGRGFTGVSQYDPIADNNSIVNAASYHQSEDSRWDILPSFNATFKIKRNFYYRVNVSKGISPPRYVDMIPNNRIVFLDPASEIFDPNSSEYTPDLATSTYRGTIQSGNVDLKPYSAWMYDNTVDLYSKNGGSVRASIFYKSINNFIGRQLIVNQPYPGVEELGVSLPEGQENLLFDISKPVNITDAQLYGFGIGFNQHFTFLPGFAKGFGLKANYAFVESNFEGAIGDAANGFPGSSKHNFNGILYYEKSGFSVRFTVAHRTNYLSNLGGVGSTRADEAHYTNVNTIMGVSIKYKLFKKITTSVGVTNLTGEDTRRYIGDDTRNLTAYFVRNPIWNIGLRYSL